MRKTKMVCLILTLSYILIQPIIASSSKKLYGEIDGFSNEPVLKRQKTSHVGIKDLLQQLSTNLFLDEHSYQFVQEKNIKEVDAAFVDKNVWQSFILIGYYFKKFKQISFSIIEEIKKMEHQDHLSSHANFNLGVLYDIGQGVEPSDVKAFEWYQKAANQRHVIAQNNLGFMYQHGQGINQSDQDAFGWYQRAANQGFADAQFNVGFMYRHGKGIKQNDIKAFEWCKKAADQGYIDAQFNLGLMYRQGIGVQQSDKEAIHWFQKAANQGYAKAQNSLGIMYEDGKGVEQSNTNAVHWYQKAASQGCANALFNLGLMYDNGQGIDQSYIKALELSKKAAIKKHNIAQKHFKSFFKIQSSIVDVENDNYLKNQTETCIENIEIILGRHDQERGANNPNSFFKEQFFSIGNLFKLYQQVVDFEQKSLEVVKAFHQADFMITCLQPIHQGLIKELDQETSLSLSLHTMSESKYLSFGSKNVELANQFIFLLENQKNKAIKAAETLTKVYTELYHDYLKKAVIAQESAKKAQNNPSATNLERRYALDNEIKEWDRSMDQILIKLEDLEIFSKIPEQVKELFVQTTAYRNRLFLMQNSFLQK